ncbi:MAG: type VI secretion system baseplate subunit TssG [Acidobacteria bacterium]|nr:type VI secretion system baseplate subunit TssG [Acidobacteriota bacterium]
MATSFRRSNPSLKQRLAQEPYYFDFFQAVRLLERSFPTRLTVGRDSNPKEEVTRFHNHISLNFPSSEINKIVFSPEDLPTQTSNKMFVRFMGMAGVNGVLPLSYTELLIERRRYKDQTLADFLDIFNHRMISLFYRAWEKYRFPVVYERGTDDYFTDYLFDTIGIGTKGLQKRLNFPDKALLLYGGLIGQKPHSISAIAAILRDFFQIPTKVEPFTGQWLKLDSESITQLGKSNSILGQSTIVGAKIWDQQSKFCLIFGPLKFQEFKEFLPIGSAYQSVIDLIRLLVGQELDFDEQLVLKKTEVPTCKITNNQKQGMLLGWTTWLKTKEFNQDDRQVVLRTDGDFLM